MSDLGTLSYFLGIEFVRSEEGIVMHQEKNITDVLKKLDMLDCNSTATTVETGNVLCKGNPNDQKVDATLYRQMIGSLRYICNSRPDITYGVGIVSRHMEHPRHSHMITVKRLLRYLKGSINFGVLFPVNDCWKIV
ncbi:PREDICTED: uncharacterized protein LOC109340709 [Lupinus angustifolius]|uniref:uncharacterized protein LOC109340709 n=1 Tax=Lupinus angustifolius TaxID=3871 RepID=UPI00092FCFCE|nr:PREDICTED: uncharacterized protein LOC109340709 [Lupinus angustifolius]